MTRTSSVTIQNKLLFSSSPEPITLVALLSTPQSSQTSPSNQTRGNLKPLNGQLLAKSNKSVTTNSASRIVKAYAPQTRSAITAQFFPGPPIYLPGRVWNTDARVLVLPNQVSFNNERRFEHAASTLNLPNLIADDFKDVRQVLVPGTKNTKVSPQQLDELKTAVLMTLPYFMLPFPLASRLLRHYLTGNGKSVEEKVDMGRFYSPAAIDKYKMALEQQAVKYAQDHPNEKEFTIRGPLLVVTSGVLGGAPNQDISYALGNYRVGGRAHYKVTRDANGQVTLEGHSQMFVHDRYNFAPTGTSFPLAIGEVHQGDLMQMALAKDPNAAKTLAQPFYYYGYEQPTRSVVTNK